MIYAPSRIDFVLIAVMILLMVIEVRLFAGLYRAFARGATRQTRLLAYAYLLVYQWAMVACLITLWIARDRPWSTLLLGSPHRGPFATCLGLALAYIVLALRQQQALLGRTELLEAVRRQIAEIEPIAPRTPHERRLWTWVAITAGCCEEVMFRGFLLAFFASLTGLIAAVAITAMLFGLFHGYYGWRGILKTAAFGLVLTLGALWSASLIPVVVLHAAIDIISGNLAYRVLARFGSTAPAEPSA